jgi:hypothetical protein
MMKKYLLLSFAACLCLGLLSWGVTGHRTIGEIAERHLSPQAKIAVDKLLGHETMAEASTWADEIRSANPETGSWHFINVPSGLSFADFSSAVKTQPGTNVYKALFGAEKTLKDNKNSQAQKEEALKFIIHFVGDMHQPMHVSHAEDKGGNTIELSFEGEDTNLHALWDSKLLDHEGLSYDKLADKFDHATPQQIAKWQSDPVIIWAWESYQISEILYGEVNTDGSTKLSKDYYDAHIPVVQSRIEKAGIRLAGVLNEIFDTPTAIKTQ